MSNDITTKILPLVPGPAADTGEINAQADPGSAPLDRYVLDDGSPASQLVATSAHTSFPRLLTENIPSHALVSRHEFPHRDFKLAFEVSHDEYSPPKYTWLRDGAGKDHPIIIESRTAEEAERILKEQNYPEGYAEALKSSYYETVLLARLQDGLVVGYKVISNTISAIMTRDVYDFTHSHNLWHDNPHKKLVGLYWALTAYFLDSCKAAWERQSSGAIIAENIDHTLLRRLRNMHFFQDSSVEMPANPWMPYAITKEEAWLILSLFRLRDLATGEGPDPGTYLDRYLSQPTVALNPPTALTHPVAHPASYTPRIPAEAPISHAITEPLWLTLTDGRGEERPVIFTWNSLEEAYGLLHEDAFPDNFSAHIRDYFAKTAYLARTPESTILAYGVIGGTPWPWQQYPVHNFIRGKKRNLGSEAEMKGIFWALTSFILRDLAPTWSQHEPLQTVLTSVQLPILHKFRSKSFDGHSSPLAPETAIRDDSDPESPYWGNIPRVEADFVVSLFQFTERHRTPRRSIRTITERKRVASDVIESPMVIGLEGVVGTLPGLTGFLPR